jgi:uncharacterized LabA/DUF88 family protein
MSVGLGLGIGSSRGQQGKTRPLEKYAFIDGAFFRGLLIEFGKEIDFDIFGEMSLSHVARFGKRVFWYDAIPAKKKSQTSSDYEKEVENKISELDRIDSQSGVFVKTGVSRFRIRDKKREQKGVDILLAVDALQTAFRGSVDELAIYTSDLDFFPLFEALQATPCRGRLFFSESRTSTELIRSADQAEPITLGLALSWCGKGPGQSSKFYPDWKPEPTIPENIIVKYPRRGDRVAGIAYDKKSGSYVAFYEDRSGRYQVRSTTFPLLALDYLRGEAIGCSYRDLARLRKG